MPATLAMWSMLSIRDFSGGRGILACPFPLDAILVDVGHRFACSLQLGDIRGYRRFAVFRLGFSGVPDTSWSSKPLKKFTCTTPPFLATARSMSSVILRGALVKARAEECDAITGAFVVAIVSQKVLSATWEISTIMPSRFISSTTCLPKSVRPL